MSLEFSLAPGGYGRIGNSPANEIHLPMVGLAAEECRLFLDQAGSLWLTRRAGSFPEPIHPPAFFQAGRYLFLLRDQEASVAGGMWRDGEPALHKASNGLPKTVVLVATLMVLAILAATIWFVNRPGGPVSGAVESPLASTSALPAGGELKTLAHPPAPTGVSTPVAEVGPAVLPPPVSDASSAVKVMDLESLAARVGPCVYLIQVIDRTGHLTATGTGFGVSADGLIATNCHVTEKGARFSLLTNEGLKFEDASLVLSDRFADLALLRIKGSGLPFLSLASTSHVPVGKRVAVYGNPRGLAGILSEGIISAPPRDLSAILPHQILPNYGVLLQTTAPISPGSSGSPLFDSEGQVLGVMTLTGPENSQNLNFAVPVEALQRMVATETVTPAVAAFSTSEDSKGGKPPVRRKSEYDHLDLSSFSESERPCAADSDFRAMLEEIDAGDWASATRTGQRLAGKYPYSANVCVLRAQCAYSQHLLSQAEAFYRRSTELNPYSSIAWCCLGMCLSDQKKYWDARVALEQARELNPSKEETWDQLVMVNMSLQDWPEAERSLGILARLAPKAAKVRARIILEYYPTTNLGSKAGKILESVGETMDLRPQKFYVRELESAASLSVRQSPGVNAAKIGSISSGAEIAVTGKTRLNAGIDWLPIASGSTRGWVVAKFLRAAE